MELSASKREIKGKKVRFLRRAGTTPASLFGHNVEALPIQCNTIELRHVLARAGRTGIVSLKLDKSKEPRNVMVREVQIEPRTGELLHVDLYQISMEEQIRVEVPIVLIGEAPALKTKENFLAHELTDLTIECLPNKIPSKVEVDINVLTESEQAIHVADLSLGDGITVLDNPEQIVVRISAGFVEKEEEKVEVEAEVEAPEGAELAERESREEDSSDS